MSMIRDADGARQTLQPEHLVGRAPGCALRIHKPYVSAQHATLRWNGEAWELKDLGSRNGTYLDGKRIVPGQEYVLRKGSKMAFGKISPEWELVDDAPATAMVVPVGFGDPIVLQSDLLALPSSEEPQVTLYRDAHGQWLIEHQNEGTTAIGNLQTFEVGTSVYRFCCPEGVHKTTLATETEVSEIGLRFSVSLDEEHVHLEVTCHGQVFDLGARAPHYLLLTLARQRLRDAQAGLSEASQGWAYLEDFARDPSMAGQQLNVDVFRLRKQFAALPVMDAANIIERRPRTRQLRVGTGHLTIEQL